jgi:Ca-activated chloride channel family protein
MSADSLPESILRTKNGDAIPLDRVSVTGTIKELAAEFAVSQLYRNSSAKNIEAVYTFPLPIGAVLLGLELEIGDRHLVGQVIEKKIAEQRYEDAVTDGDTAVMVQVTGPGLFTVNIGNLQAGESAVVRYRYALLLNWQGDCIRLVLPTTLAPRYGDPAKAGLADHQVPENSLLVEYPFELSLAIEGKLSQGEISCPTHPILTSRSETGFVVTLDANARLDKDFVLLMRGDQASSACIYDQADGGRVVLASMRIPPLPKKEEQPLHLKVVIDCSGSMAGMSIAQARKAALEILNQLRPGDRFNFTLFGSSYEHFWSELMPAEAKYITAAWKQLEMLDANLGGTETGKALNAVYAIGKPRSEAVRRLKEKLRLEKPELEGTEPLSQILLITDGQVWEHEPIVKAAIESKHRVFTVGVGFSSVEGLVGELAKKTGGACELATPQEGMTERILTQFHRLRQPPVVLKGIKLGVKPDWFTPMSKSAFAGDTVHVYAGVTGSAPTTVSLGGEDAHGNRFFVEADIVPTTWAELPRMAAAARIASPKTSDDLKLKLALEYQLLTEMTNYLIIDERADKADELPELAKVPHMLPTGWGGVGSAVACASIGLRTGTDNLPVLNSLSSGRRLRSPTRSERLSSSGIDKYDIPAFLRRGADGGGPTIKMSVSSLDSVAEPIDSYDDRSPQALIANLYAGLPGFNNPDVLPVTIETLEDYGLPIEFANALREIFTEGWPERIIVAAFLMAMTKAPNLSSEFPREFNRLIFANWKRTGTDQTLLAKVGAVIDSVTTNDWKLESLRQIVNPVAS